MNLSYYLNSLFRCKFFDIFTFVSVKRYVVDRSLKVSTKVEIYITEWFIYNPQKDLWSSIK